jgi:hypothetical protein
LLIPDKFDLGRNRRVGQYHARFAAIAAGWAGRYFQLALAADAPTIEPVFASDTRKSVTLAPAPLSNGARSIEPCCGRQPIDRSLFNHILRRTR